MSGSPRSPGLDPGRRARIDALCHAAIGLMPDERAALLDREAGDDPVVHREVQRILAGLDGETAVAGGPSPARGTNFILDHPPLIEVVAWGTAADGGARLTEPSHGGTAHDEVARPTADLDRLVPTRRIGPWTLEHVLGEGGFGVVIAARQETPIRRVAAIKLLKPTLDDRAVLRRFEAERRILAMLDHPGIARVLDAGITDETSGRAGIPYVVMDLVDGEPVTEACRRLGLEPRDRIALLADACLPVRHAHLRGIIHRDLKPSNILVALHDGRPTPVIIDFGIARALIPDDRSPHEALTRTSDVIGTPRYMAPERRSGDPQAVDMRADVYALGAVLRDLLDPDQSEPPRGEVAWIIQRCLEEDPERRYPGVADLEADLRNLLAGRAVLARPASPGYRLRKLVGRHPWTSAGTISALLLVAGLGVATAAALARARTSMALQEGALALAAERATNLQRESERIDATNRFLLHLLSAPSHSRPNPGGVRTADVRVRDLLAEASASLDTDLAGDPAQIGRLRMRIAATWADLDEVAAAEAELDRLDALATTAALPPDVRSEMAQLRAMILATAGSHDEALAKADEALAFAERSRSARRWTAAANARTSVLHNAGRRAEALAWGRTVAKEAGRRLDPTDDRAITALNNVGGILGQLGQVEEAIQWLTRALEAFERAGQANHMDAMITRANLSGNLRRAGHHEEADRHAGHLYEQRARILGPLHPHAQSSAAAWAGRLLDLDRGEEALGILRPLVARLEASDGTPDAATHWQVLHTASVVERAVGDPGAALARAEEASELAERTWDREAWQWLHSRIAMAESLRYAGRTDEADTVRRELREQTDLADDQAWPGGLFALAEARIDRELQRPAAALAHARRAAEILPVIAKPWHRDRIAAERLVVELGSPNAASSTGGR